MRLCARYQVKGFPCIIPPNPQNYSARLVTLTFWSVQEVCCSKKLWLTSRSVMLFPLHGPSALAFSFPWLNPPPPVVLSLSVTLEAFPDLHLGMRPPYLHFSDRSTYTLYSCHFSACLAPLSVTRLGLRLTHCLWHRTVLAHIRQ